MTAQPEHHDLIRAYADGELSAADAAAFEARLANEPDLARRVAFERALRDRVSSVLGDSPSAPDALRGRIAAALASDTDETSLPPAQTDVIGGDTNRGFWSRSRVNVFAVAACLALVGGAVLIGIFLPNIDQQQQRAAAAQLVQEAAALIATEHNLCADNADRRAAKLRFDDVDAAALGIATYLETPDDDLVPDLSALDLTFIGAGPCKVPGEHRSVHLMFKGLANGANADSMLSIYLTADAGQFDGGADPMTIGEWYISDLRDAIGDPVWRTTDGDLVWFICTPDTALLEAAADHLTQRMQTR